MQQKIRNITKEQMIIAAVVGTLCIIVVLLGLWFLRRAEDTVAIKVGEVKIYSRDYNNYLDQASKAKIEKGAALATLIDYHRTKEAVRTSGLPVSQELANQREAVYRANEPNIPEVFARMRAYNSAVYQTIALRDVDGAEARLVRLPFKSRENEYGLPTKEEARKLMDKARSEVATGSEKGIQEIEKRYPSVGVVNEGIFLNEGALVGYNGDRINKFLPIPTQEIREYLKNCKESVCGVKEVAGDDKLFFMQILTRINKLDKNQVKAYETAREQVKVVNYVD